jgi:hypothetical protein
VDVFVDRLSDQDVGVHLTQSKGIDAIIMGVDDPGCRIIMYDLLPELIEFLRDRYIKPYKTDQRLLFLCFRTNGCPIHI